MKKLTLKEVAEEIKTGLDAYVKLYPNDIHLRRTLNSLLAAYRYFVNDKATIELDAATKTFFIQIKE